jgi:hypothetical protein
VESFTETLAAVLGENPFSTVRQLSVLLGVKPQKIYPYLRWLKRKGYAAAAKRPIIYIGKAFHQFQTYENLWFLTIEGYSHFHLAVPKGLQMPDRTPKTFSAEFFKNCAKKGNKPKNVLSPPPF